MNKGSVTPAVLHTQHRGWLHLLFASAG